MQTPNGLDEINSAFGNISAYVNESGNLSNVWNRQFLSEANLPYPLALAWNTSITVSRITVHRLLVPVFEDVFQKIYQAGLQTKANQLGGAFSFRQQRTGKKLSTHAWGIAIDLDPGTNEQGEAGDMDPQVVKIFTDAGFEWGGSWPLPRKDAMHFQFATGY